LAAIREGARKDPALQSRGGTTRLNRFAGKVVLITGASSGIGAGLAREFARKGAAVALLARRAERLRALAGEIRGAGGHALAIPCDVTREGDLERAVALTVSGLGPIDVAVANAGFGVVGPFAKLRLDDYRRQFETNVFGVLRTAYATLDELCRSHGTLVIVGSVSGYLAAPSASPYAMSKFAVRALADALRGELAPRGVSVVLITPGFVVSEIRRVDNRGRLRADSPDPVPRWLRMPTQRAARAIVRAVAGRRRELIITRHGKLAVFLARHTPRVLASLVRRSRMARREPC
jgi:short-subunit dehydrogenase